MIDFNDEPWKRVKVPNPLFFKAVRIAKAVLNCDVFIGVPVLKTHHLAGITVALKNLYGIIPREDKKRYHRMNRVEEAVIDLNSVRSSDMVVVDGTYTLLHWGIIDEYVEKHQMDLALCGFDPVAVDTVSAKVLGIDPKTLRFLKWAEEKGLGTGDLSNINVVGKSIDEVFRGKMMTSVEYDNKKYKRIKIINGEACTGCFGRIATALHTVDESKLSQSVYVLMGPKAKPREDGINIVCGNCLAPTFYNEFKGTFISGCPPNLKLFLGILKKLGLK